jgi:hypothetical protein
VNCLDPQGLKPACLSALGGMAEAVPFPKQFIGIASRNMERDSQERPRKWTLA